MKKRNLTLTLLLATLLIVSGCNSSNDSSNNGGYDDDEESDYITLKECYSLADNTSIETVATVTGTDSVGFFIQDDTASFYAYFEDNYVNCTVGKKYLFRGTVTSYAGNKQIAKGFTVRELGEGNITTVDVDNIDTFKANQYAPIRANVRLAGDPRSFKEDNDNSFNVELNGYSVPVFIKKKLSTSSMFKNFDYIKKYEYFTIAGAFSNAYEGIPQISLSSPNQIVVNTPSSEQEIISKAKQTISNITSLNNKKINYSLYLPTTLSDNVTLSWSSNNTSILSDKGVVTRPDSNTSVTLSVDIKIDNEKKDSVSTNIVVLAKDSSSTVNLTEEAQNYYSTIDFTKSDKTSLKNDLYNLISNHTTIPYTSLINVYSDSDTYTTEDGSTYLNDIYSNNHYKLNGVVASASVEGKGWNKEHAIPRSWFSKQSPMDSDAFHIYPVDTFVNSKRGNVPYGTVKSATYTSSNGSKVGGGYFEVADEYKGDIARTYFYMCTAYQNKCGSWSGSVFQSSFPHLKSNQLTMFLEWANNDPVSEKEIIRNNGIYLHQGNRNPFVDVPSLANTLFA